MAHSIVSPSDEVLAEAATWLMRIKNETSKPVDELALQKWIQSDASHATAFQAVSATWEIAGGLPRDLRGSPAYFGVEKNRRAVMAGLGSLIAVGGTTAFWRKAQAGIYQTEVGEQKHLSLDDGTRVLLDTDTRLKVTFSDTQRSAELQYGRANFRVAHDGVRPFIVNAAASMVVSASSNLDVARDADQISILLIHGSAEVLHSNAKPMKLSDGQRFVALGDQPGRVDQPNMTSLLAWQTGQAIFDNSKLSKAVMEMNRYSTVKLTIADAQTGELRVSGIYYVGDNVAFANSVSKLLPIKVVQEGAIIHIIPYRLSQAPG